eukprot:355982-Chlamydomonas_euryale.AAC.3
MPVNVLCACCVWGEVALGAPHWRVFEGCRVRRNVRARAMCVLYVGRGLALPAPPRAHACGLWPVLM